MDEAAEAEENTRMAQIDAAWDAHEKGLDEGPDEGGAEEVDASPEPEPEEETPEEGGEEAPEPEVDEEPAAAEEKESAAPVGLSAAAKEAWKDAPEPIRKEIEKREKDYQKGLQKNAEWAKRAQDMDAVLQPYQQYMAMNGGARAIPDLLATASTLQMGTPEQRAQTAADIIKQYGINISMLDSILAGEAQAAPQLSPIEQRMQDFLDSQERAQQNSIAAKQQQVTQSVEAFLDDPKNEFANDVSAEMADLLEMAGRRGENLTMDEAYQKACRLRPDIWEIIQARETTKQVSKRKTAASSISGSPEGSATTAPPADRRAAIEAAWDHENRV